MQRRPPSIWPDSAHGPALITCWRALDTGKTKCEFELLPLAYPLFLGFLVRLVIGPCEATRATSRYQDAGTLFTTTLLDAFAATEFLDDLLPEPNPVL